MKQITQIKKIILNHPERAVNRWYNIKEEEGTQSLKPAERKSGSRYYNR